MPRPARVRGLLLICCSEGLSWLKGHGGEQVGGGMLQGKLALPSLYLLRGQRLTRAVKLPPFTSLKFKSVFFKNVNNVSC